MKIPEINKNATHSKGAIALPTILMLASILLAIGLAINLSSNNKIETIKNNENALSAFYLSEAGIKDALIKIARNKNYCTNYTLQTSKGSADIVFDGSPPPNQIIITSTGVSDNNTKKIHASYNIDNNGKLTQLSWQEIF